MLIGRENWTSPKALSARHLQRLVLNGALTPSPTTPPAGLGGHPQGGDGGVGVACLGDLLQCLTDHMRSLIVGEKVMDYAVSGGESAILPAAGGGGGRWL